MEIRNLSGSVSGQSVTIDLYSPTSEAWPDHSTLAVLTDPECLRLAIEIQSEPGSPITWCRFTRSSAGMPWTLVMYEIGDRTGGGETWMTREPSRGE